MIRIPTHTIEDAPVAARPLLADMVQLSPTGRNYAAARLHVPAPPAPASERA